MAPFLSKAQRRYMHAKHPKIAEEWEKEMPKKMALPERKGMTKHQKAIKKLQRGMSGKKH